MAKKTASVRARTAKPKKARASTAKKSTAKKAPAKKSSAKKWGQPVWEGHGPLAWLNTSSGHATFGFWRGAELVDSDGILEGVGARMRHVKLAPGELTPAMRARLAALLRQAVDLNVAKGDPTRRKPA